MIPGFEALDRLAVALFAGDIATTAPRVFLASLGSFTAMYVIFSITTWFVTARLLPALKVGAPIDQRNPAPGQIGAEIRSSTVSILVFALFAVGIHVLIAHGWLSVNWHSAIAWIALETLVLLAWNEVHFYLCHRLLHTPWLFRHVHLEHHRSIRVTPLAAFRFHWFEALLLSTVMPIAMLVHEFSVWSLLALPPVSLALNMLGHSNYDVAPGLAEHQLPAFGRRHSLHHHRP
ncbi:MAG: sterol desaturase family protein, partial [Burkholderiales bacterium]